MIDKNIYVRRDMIESSNKTEELRRTSKYLKARRLNTDTDRPKQDSLTSSQVRHHSNRAKPPPL